MIKLMIAASIMPIIIPPTEGEKTYAILPS
jgi:hypothetical protein